MYQNGTIFALPCSHHTYSLMTPSMKHIYSGKMTQKDTILKIFLMDLWALAWSSSCTPSLNFILNSCMYIVLSAWACPNNKALHFVLIQSLFSTLNINFSVVCHVHERLLCMHEVKYHEFLQRIMYIILRRSPRLKIYTSPTCYIISLFSFWTITLFDHFM